MGRVTRLIEGALFEVAFIVDFRLHYTLSTPVSLGERYRQSGFCGLEKDDVQTLCVVGAMS